jgi:predicted transposase/invertase (TIGR01784 family)
MPKTKNKIHDSLFHDLCSDPRLAIDLMLGSINKKLSTYLKWDSLSIIHKEYAKGDLSQLKCDFVCRIQLEGSGIEPESYLYTIIEHQSTWNRNLPYRSNNYATYLAKYLIDKKIHQTFPIINSIWIYASGSSIDQGELSLYKTMQKLGLAESYSFCLPTVIDLSTISQEEIIERFGKIAIGLLLLKQGAQKEFLLWIKNNPQLIRNLVDTGHFEIAIMYILECETKSTDEELLKALDEIFPKEQQIMSVADQIRKKGRQEGIVLGEQKGRQEEKIEMAKNMLKLNMGLEKIVSITKLSQEQIQSLSMTK